MLSSTVLHRLMVLRRPSTIFTFLLTKGQRRQYPRIYHKEQSRLCECTSKRLMAMKLGSVFARRFWIVVAVCAQSTAFYLLLQLESQNEHMLVSCLTFPGNLFACWVYPGFHGGPWRAFALSSSAANAVFYTIVVWLLLRARKLYRNRGPGVD